MTSGGVKDSWLLFIRILQHEYNQGLETGGGGKNFSRLKVTWVLGKRS